MNRLGIFSFLLILLAVFLSVMAIDFDDPFSDDFITELIKRTKTWKAGRNFNNSLRKFRYRNLLGVHGISDHRLLQRMVDVSRVSNLTSDFDSRTQWPKCPTINQIRDQGKCGSCWAIAAVEAMSDRECIHSNGKSNFIYSVEDLLSCCDNCGSGCSGGFPGMAWKYWVEKGIVSGGGYNTTQGCKPYTIYPTDYTDNASMDADQDTPKCVKSCRKGFQGSYLTDKRYGNESYTVASDQDKIREEIAENGPVECIFTVYEDFLHYKSGVYQHTSGKEIGGHAVRILGWGTENGTPYWLMANSWGAQWGDKGFFKILRGKNHCDVEKNIFAGLPKLSTQKVSGRKQKKLRRFSFNF